MDGQFSCPYCGQPKVLDGASPADYCGCRFCGLKSALVESSGGDAMLIVDRRMPYLKRRCQELSEQMPDVNIVVDRRIAQDPIEGIDRRAAAPSRQLT